MFYFKNLFLLSMVCTANLYCSSDTKVKTVKEFLKSQGWDPKRTSLVHHYADAITMKACKKQIPWYEPVPTVNPTDQNDFLDIVVYREEDSE